MLLRIVDTVLLTVAWIAELAAAAVILAGIFSALLHLVRDYREHRLRRDVRISLGNSLILGLEFLVAADVLVTAVTPTWSRLGQVAVIVVLRIVLSYFLEQELRRFHERQGEEEL